MKRDCSTFQILVAVKADTLADLAQMLRNAAAQVTKAGKKAEKEQEASGSNLSAEQMAEIAMGHLRGGASHCVGSYLIEEDTRESGAEGIDLAFALAEARDKMNLTGSAVQKAEVGTIDGHGKHEPSVMVGGTPLKPEKAKAYVVLNRHDPTLEPGKEAK